jgi:hypothetical protein
MDNVTLILTEVEAKNFIEFQKNYELFMLLLEKKVFNQKNSAVTLHFDHNGTLQTIQRADFLYSKKHER